MTETEQLEQTCINTIRTLSMDAVQAANSGHPGTPMAMAPVAYCLWQRFLRYDPQDPIWPNRDRFVLSMGHASMLLYSLLHLCGVKAVNRAYERLGDLAVPLDDIKRFRQLDSKCPGHPEYRWTSGVETTTGPLGQGASTSVGMAIAGGWMAAYFNRPGFEMFNYDVYALCGDGCMMEGISGEAASLAEESFEDELLEHPQYTRPRTFEGLEIPEVLLSGHHQEVARWRRRQREETTRERRPDLWAAHLAKAGKKDA